MLNTGPVAPSFMDGTLCHPRHLWVQSATVNAAQLPKGVTVNRVFPQIGFTLLNTPPDSLKDSKVRLQSLGFRVSVDRCARPAYTPNDPRWPDEWHLRTIKADLAWDRSLGTSRAVVAIMDTGVDTSHVDLAGNIWVNPHEIAGNGIDDDGNGYVDDINGWDFDGNDPVPNDVNGHGTSCAGIAAAVGDNGIGISGVAPRARIMCLKAANDDGYFYDSTTVPAYLYAADNGANVVSMSFFSDSISPAERAAVAYLANRNVLPVAAAGNDTTVFPYYPGSYEQVVGVAAINSDLKMSSFSDWGSWVDVAAPGNGLLATKVGNGYGSFGGTSGACPHVAGVAALLFGASGASGVTAQSVRAAIEDTAITLNQPPMGEFSNYGLVDAQAALNRLLDGGTTVPTPRVRWISPLGRTGTDRLRIYGRALDRNAIFAYNGRSRITPLAVTRDYIDIPASQVGPSITVGSFQGNLLTIPVPETAIYPMIEASSDDNGQVFGGYRETFLLDKQSMRVTRRNSGNIIAEMAFKMIPTTGPAKFTINRAYANGGEGRERVQIYNWASGSYPYGSWVNLSDIANAADAPLTTTKTVNDPSRFVDYEGCVYVRVVRDAVPEGGELNVNVAYFE